MPHVQLSQPDRRAVADTMLAWERFLTGHPRAVPPSANFVVSSWKRSMALGVNPTGREAPLLARGDAMQALRHHHAELLDAASGIVSEMMELLAGSRSILLLTTHEGVVLEAVGDLYTLGQGADIHLSQGGDWSEAAIGTNGIGTALATGRPAQVHAAEHYCEGIKRWTCAAAPIYDPGSGAVLGVVDISGPPATYQRTNLALAVTIARQIEAALAERMAADRAELLQACLSRLSLADSAGLMAIDRTGRLVHSAGRILAPVALGQRLPGIGQGPVADWASRLPEGWRPEWFSPIQHQGRTVGAMLVVPEQRSRNHSGSEADPMRAGFDAIIGRSPPMAALIARATTLAGHRVPVLIEGETGTGKELVARALHGDRGQPFIVYNCGAASRELIAADLFGHVRGAFTGATSEGRPGRFELAHKGTLCLDEIGELPLDLQSILLRVLEEGVIYRLGDPQPRRVDVRLIAVTNRVLAAEVEAGRFRRDLFYRIGVTTLTVPPLRERNDDIPDLASHFAAQAATRHGVAQPSPDPAMVARLRHASWPGNVRQLSNVIADWVLTGHDSSGVQTPHPAPAPETATLAEAERDRVARAVRDSYGNISRAARILNISRSTLYRKLGSYGS